MSTDSSLPVIFTFDTTAHRTAFTPNPASSKQLYIWSDSDNQPNTYIWNGAAWVQINPGAGAGTVTHTAGALTANELMFGNGGADAKVGNLTGDVTTAGGTATTLAASGVAAGTYPRAVVTFDIKGRATAASSGPRTGTTASSATPSINTDNVDVFTITALSTAITSFTTNLTGTPINGQQLTIRILDNGTARAITWGAKFISRGATLPTTTVAGKYLYVGFVYNSTSNTFDCIATAQEA